VFWRIFGQLSDYFPVWAIFAITYFIWGSFQLKKETPFLGYYFSTEKFCVNTYWQIDGLGDTLGDTLGDFLLTHLVTLPAS
jgi:hypothetical protein